MTHHKKVHRFLSMLLALVLMIGLMAPIPAQAAESVLTIEQVDNDTVTAELPMQNMPDPISDPAQENSNVRVSIVLKTPSALEAGFSTKGIAANAEAMTYRSNLEREQRDVQSVIEAKVLHSPMDVVWNLTLVANVISANVPANAIAEIEALPGVDHVTTEMQYAPHVVSKGGDYAPNMAVSGQMTGASQAWEEGYTGAGTRIAVVDTGLDTDHQSFDPNAYKHAIQEDALRAEMTYEEFLRTSNFMDTSDTDAVLKQLNAYKRHVAANGTLTAKDLYVNDKTPYGYNYIDGTLDITHDHDTSGEHGSHVAGISAANRYLVQGGEFLNAMDEVHVTGTAPDAQLLIMKVFGKKGGAFDSDIMAAIEDAVILGADSVNLSLGSASAGTALCPDDTYQKIMEQLVESDTVVVISAGNSGNWGDNTPYGYLYSDGANMDTVGSPGSYTNALTVASVDNDGTISPTILVGEKSMGYYEAMANYVGTPYGNAPFAELDTSADGTGTEYDYLLVDGIGKPEDYAGMDLTGKIVFCSRGEITYTEKADNAAALGAAALVVYNNQEQGTVLMDLSGYQHKMPAVFVTVSSGNHVRMAGKAQTTETGISYYIGKLTISRKTAGHFDESQCKSMSTFSSWGVPGDLSMKPEVTAPGGNIYSVNGAVPETDQYELMSGTSMAAPQISGQMALVQQYIREQNWQEAGLTSRGLAQALLMSTAVPMKNGANGLYYSVLNQGAGLTNVRSALRTPAYLTVEDQSDGKVKVELGDDPQRTGAYTFRFTLHNLSEEALSYQLSADVLTQNVFAAEDGTQLLDKLTRTMDADTVFYQNGQPIPTQVPMNDFDFNGDGRVNKADAQALSDFVTLGNPLINHADQADLNGDGAVTTYDVHCFLNRYQSAVTVPAKGSATVEVRITLTEEEKARLDRENPNGAYVEAYLHAQPMASTEGELLPILGIPVLGYYGNWTDPSMFDLGSHETYACGAETRAPYMGSAHGNALGVVYGDRQMEGIYYFGGNPVVPDEVLMPERNAINLERGDYFPAWQFAPIRNAAASWFQASNETTGEILASRPGEEISAAFYAPQYQQWMNTPATMELDLRPDMEEGERGLLSLTLVPEAYTEADGSFDWDRLGRGTTREVPFVVDNHDPVIHDVRILKEQGVIEVDASDNQFVAGVYLYDVTGRNRLSFTGSFADVEEGETRTFSLPLEGVDGYKFILQVSDYAANMATYRIKETIGDPEPRPNQIVFDENSNKWIRFDRSETGYYTWDTKTWCDTNVMPRAATSVGGYSFLVSDGSKLFVTPTDSMMDTVLIRKLPEPMDDMAYDAETDLLYAVTAQSRLYSIDKLDGTVQDLGTIGVSTNTLAVNGTGTFYCSTNDGKVYSFTLDTMEAPQELCQVEKGAYDTFQGLHTMEYDPRTGHVIWIPRSDNGYGYQSSQYYDIDPEAKTATKILSPVYRGAIGLSYPDWTDGADQWAEPSSQPTKVTFEASQITVFQGYTAKVFASALPWTLHDRNVIYTSDDDTVASVDADGVVTGVSTGTTTIRAESALDSTVYDECVVEVQTLDVTVNGLLQDEKGVPQSFQWNLADGSGWQPGYKLDNYIKSVAKIPNENAYYMLSSNEGTMHKRDFTTGEDLEEPSTVYLDNNYWILDMSYSNYFSQQDGGPRIYGVRENSVLAPTDPMAPEYVHIDAGFARFLPGIAVGGTETITYKDWYNEVETESEIFYMMDDSGNVWRCNMFRKDGWGTTRFDWTYTIYRSDLKIRFQGPDFQGNCSMVLGDDGALYLSAYTGKQSELYRLVFDPANKRYVSTYLGGFGKDIWPAALLTADSNAPMAPQAPAGTHLASVDFAEKAQAVPKTPAAEAEPQQNTISLNLTVPAGRTNGLTEVHFDPTQLTLDTIHTKADIVSFKADEGTVLLGYAWAEAASENGAYAELTFQGTQTCTSDVRIVETQQNERDTQEEKIVTLEVDHEWGDWVVTKKATCQEEGEETRTCSRCGETEIRAIPKADHQYKTEVVEPTCTEKGYTIYTCTVCGEQHTGDEVPALGHDWGPWTVTRKPTTTEPGMESRICLHCGETETREIPVLAPLPFTDVDEDQWYGEYVRYVYDHQWMIGVSDSLFAPYGTVTRGQLVTVLYRMAGEPETTKTHGFTDVDEDGFYAEAVAWGYAEGIIQGVTETRFAPHTPVTREQMGTFFYRFCKGKAGDRTVLERFPDGGEVSDYARDAMAWAVENEIIEGALEGGITKLLPQAATNRAQLAAIIYRVETR